MSDPTITVVALLVTGYLLMAAEIFVIPGFGVAGIGGFICLGVGCYLAYDHFGYALRTGVVACPPPRVPTGGIAV